MHFHYCGSPLHDFVHNTVVLLLTAPDWVPLVHGLKPWAREKLRRAHKEHDHGEHNCVNGEIDAPQEAE